jgi:hypothetical protein
MFLLSGGQGITGPRKKCDMVFIMEDVVEDNGV